MIRRAHKGSKYIYTGPIRRHIGQRVVALGDASWGGKVDVRVERDGTVIERVSLHQLD